MTAPEDASHAAKIAVANLYLPLSEAQAIAAASKPLQSVSPFAVGDVNLLFIRADQEKITSVAAAAAPPSTRPCGFPSTSPRPDGAGTPGGNCDKLAGERKPWIFSNQYSIDSVISLR